MKPSTRRSSHLRESPGAPLAEEIRAGRQQLGFTQAQLAALLGTTANTVARWERGVVVPSASWGLRLRVLLRSKGRFIPGADPITTWRSLWRLSQRYRGAAMSGRTNPDDPLDPGAAVPRLLKAARSAGARAVVMGGLAAIAWGVERLTKDLDAVGVPKDTLHDFLAAADEEGFLIPSGLAPEQLGESPFKKVTIYWPLTPSATSARVASRSDAVGGGAMPVDVMLMDDEFTESAVARARTIEAPSGPLPVVSVEDLLVFKLIAYREKDLGDARTLMHLHASVIDERYVKRWTKKLGAIERWDDLVSEHESGATGL